MRRARCGAAGVAAPPDRDVDRAKRDLQQAVGRTDRGGIVTREQRGIIEEAQVQDVRGV